MATLTEQLNRAWIARRRSTAIDSAMRFASEGLLLGAGTILAKSVGGAQRISIDRREPRLRALLVAAHLRSPSAESLSHLRRAAQRWNEGEGALAAMHLALSGLHRLERPDADAHRLFLAEGLLEAGVEPAAIIAAIDRGGNALIRLQKYDPDQPRVPAGSGRTSGEWTSTNGSSSVDISSGSENAAPMLVSATPIILSSDAPQPLALRPEVNPSTVTEVVMPPTGSLDACEEAESDCVKAAIQASRGDAANDNSRFLDLARCAEAGWACEMMSWGIEDFPLPLAGGVRFPHGGLVLINKGKLDRYLPPLFDRPPPIRRVSADNAGFLGPPESSSAEQDVNIVGYSCPPWDLAPNETVSPGQVGFTARRRAIRSLSSKMDGRIVEEICSLGKQWGKVVRAKVSYEHGATSGTALLTCWSIGGFNLNLDLRLESCCGRNDKFPQRAGVR